ncbi:MAG TPA: helical backbone metal receptor [Bdellovibrionota bacterium]|nr:helical backbone metal receptor [Bdellovibrionota bacterium]
MSQRVVSLVPSITENLILFGKLPVGRTSFCIQPKGKVESIPVVGGTKTPKVQKILDLHPDFVIANREENRKEDVEAMGRAGLTVWVTYPTRVADVVPLMKELAAICEKQDTAHKIILECEATIEKLQHTKPRKRKRVVTLIWKDPWMAIGGETYSDDLIRVSGGDNPFSQPENRYPQVTDQDILAARPDLLLLPSEPYAFTQSDRSDWSRKTQEAGLRTRVEFISGENLTWFGPRVREGLSELRRLIESEAVS